MSPRRSLSKKSTVTVVHPKSGRSMDLSGEELDEFCRGHGLCRRCARVITHKRVFKLFGTNHPKWEPLTVLKPTTAADEWNNNGDNKGGNQGGNHGNVEQYKKNDEIDNDEDDSYLVYKGYCLGEGCYTMKEARRLLGETGDKNSRYNKENSGWRSRMTKSTRFKKKNPKRPGKRRTRTNPETGSVVTNAASLSSLRSSSSSSIVTTSSASTRHSIISGMSGLSGFSGMSGSVKSTRRSGRSRRSTQRSSSRSSSDDDDDEHNRKEFSSEKNAVSHIVVERLEKLVSYDYFTVLDLSNIDMSNSSKSTKNESNANLDALVKAIGIAKTLKAVVLEKCGLGDEGLEKLAGGLEQQIVTTSLHKSKSADAGDVLLPSILRLRGNRIGNRGVQALEFLFRSSSTLKEVDLSDNHIGSKGACSLFESLAQNPNGIPLSVLNLSQNEIWELSSPMENNNASTFLYTNSTLKELNLDGNLLHDGGAEFIAQSIRSNRRCALKRLHLGWNAIGDDGVRALGKALESNTSLEVLGLAENDITNTGARALLAALAVNTSVKEISGLYHNPIERKFIIVAIKRLLHRKSSVRGDKNNTDPARSLANSEHSAAAAASTRTGATTAADNEDYEDSEEMIVPLKPAASNKAVVVVDDGFSRLQRSYEETARSSQGGDHHTHASTASHSGGSLALEAIENWDWGGRLYRSVIGKGFRSE
ncbi:unnamed protein product [Pseudo-nitzschia multistriata]|uniref:Uncharacterized protein n=1 Tax=Pseudo-nitzschia multistriata TaxID=183589 RepID=A0A448ZPB6_9STRA|nr:unnamed protein product [Pseudo-nitzschia multistriata]